MANCNYNLVTMPFTFFSISPPLPSIFMFFIFNAPFYQNIFPFQMLLLLFFFILLPAIWECVVAEIKIKIKSVMCSSAI